jgi:hypothetical protein
VSKTETGESAGTSNRMMSIEDVTDDESSRQEKFVNLTDCKNYILFAGSKCVIEYDTLY